MFSISRSIIKCKNLTEVASFNLVSSSGKNRSALRLQQSSSQVSPFRFLCSKQSHIQNVSNDENNGKNKIDYDSITGGDKELEHKLKVVMLETEVLRQEGKLVPDDDYLKGKHWKEMLVLPSRTRRKKYLEYLFKLSKTQENRNLKKIEKQKSLEDFKASRVKENLSLEEFAQTYDLQHNNIFLRFYDSTMNEMYNNKLIQAIQFGEKLIVDCGYEQNMTKRENENCSKQLMLVFSENRYHEEPFDIHFCNAALKDHLMTTLHKFMPPMYEPWFPMNIHEESYLDIFPKEKLIYLTPHCHEEMQRYEPDSIYIIGGIVDKVNTEPLSLAKAKKEGIRMQKFPLDRYLQWGSGSGKSLTINQSLSVMLDIKKTGDWNYSLRHVPRRKLVISNLRQNIDRATNSLRYDNVKKERKQIKLPNVKTIWNE